MLTHYTDVADAPASPEEKEFEDDDGTIYIWDSKLRKFVAKDIQAAAGAEAAYDVEAMTFAGDDEVIPTLAAAKAAEEAALDEAENLERKVRVC